MILWFCFSSNLDLKLLRVNSKIESYSIKFSRLTTRPLLLKLLLCSFYYGQNCLNGHLCKTTTRLRRSLLSLPKQTLIHSWLYKMITCLTRPATTFLRLPNEKNLPKSTTMKTYPVKKWETNIRQQCIKNKRLSDYLYTSTTWQYKVCLMSIKTVQFIKLHKII